MLIWPTSLPVRESQRITALHRGHELDLPRSAQMVNREKDLVPREVRAATRHVFEVACLYMNQHVDHLSFRGDLWRHVPPFEERNESLRGNLALSVPQDGVAGCRERSSVAQRVTSLKKAERAATFSRLRSFGPVPSQGTVAKYLIEGKGGRFS